MRPPPPPPLLPLFFAELDYVREGQNATKFAALIADDLPQVPNCFVGSSSGGGST